ncbi:hypothetical protein BH10BDE1_BH10BDE1_08970 [soil metagenome]
MKTKSSFASNFYFVVSFLVCAAMVGGPSLTLASSEVVKAGSAPRGKQVEKEDLPTPEETKMGAVKSPYRACDGVLLVEHSPEPSSKTSKGYREWKQKEDFWAAYPTKGCDSTKVNCTRKVQYIPDTHFYKSFDGRVGANLSGKESANDFLVRVADTSIAKVKTRIAALKAQKACADSPTPACQKDMDARVAVLKAKIPEFRLIIARINEKSSQFLYSAGGTMPMNGKILISRDFHGVDGKMIVPKNMPNLEDKDFYKLSEEMDAFLKVAKAEHVAEVEAQIKARNMTPMEDTEWRNNAFGPGRSTGWIAPRMAAAKEKNVAEYNKILGTYPELGYMNESDLAPKEMSKKLALAISDAEETMSDMTDAKKSASSTPGEVTKKRMGFAAHTQTIEEMLANEGDGRSCAVANATLNELGTVKTKEGVIVGGLTVVTSVGLGVAGALVGKGAAAGLVAMTGSSAAAVGNTLGALAFATGAGAGFAQTAHEVSAANDTIRDAKVGVVKVEDATKAIESKNISLAAGILNFQGGGAYLGAAVGVGIGAAGAGTKLLLSSVLKNGAKGGGGPAAKEAEALAANIIKANSGDAVAAKSVVAAAAAAETKLFKGVKPEALDRENLGAIAQKGLAGTPEAPDEAIAAAYVDRLAGMQGPAKEKYRDAVKEVTAGLKPANELGDAARQRAVAEAVVEVGDGNRIATVNILNDLNWDRSAIQGHTAVEAGARKEKGTFVERARAALRKLREKVGLGKQTAKEEDQLLTCGGFMPRPGIAGPYDGNPFGATEPKFMACAAPTDTTL